MKPDVTTMPATTEPVPTLPDNIRLPEDLNPERYVIHLRPYLQEGHARRFEFDGEVDVHLTVKKTTKEIILHINDMTIDNSTVKLKNEAGNEMQEDVGPDNYDVPRQFFIVKAKTDLVQGKTYTLSIKYVGNLNDLMKGFYRSSYTDTNGEKRWLATTQFQATDARRAFPCMDEPGFKSKFKISITCHQNYTAISNAPQASNKTVDTDYVEFEFKETEKMSTYLVAFVVSDFDYIYNQTEKKVDMRVFAKKEAIDLGQGDYSLKAGVAILDYFGTLFGTNFPLPKQDMIAIPDFSAGAMENWGLVTYRETALLYQDGTSSTSAKQRVCLVVAHELAHQWFGNLVTPKWWYDLWLNEGFANFVEYIGIEKVEPEMDIMDQFVTADLHPTLVADSLTSSHPISVEVSHPSQIAELFDSISYGKGASVIRMMDSFLTRAKFQEGLENYLKKFAYDNAESDDLWAELTAVADKIDVKEIMDTWTKQMGYPVVMVNKTGTEATFTQSRFLLDGTTDPNEKNPFNYKWKIPLTYTTKS